MFALISLLSLIPSALSAPIFGLSLGSDSDTASAATTAFSLSDVESTLLRPAQFARVAYCSSQSITTWTCGAPCQVLGNVTFLQSGGGTSQYPVVVLYLTCHLQTRVSSHCVRRPSDPACNIILSLDTYRLHRARRGRRKYRRGPRGNRLEKHVSAFDSSNTTSYFNSFLSLSILNDAKFGLVDLNSTRFPETEGRESAYRFPSSR